MPIAEIIYDFYDKLKTVTQGYGSFDYEFIGYRESDLVKLDILVNGERIDALSMMIHRERSRARALRYMRALKGRDSPSALQNCHPGGHRGADHSPLNHIALPQGCDRQVLRRRHHPQAQASGKAEGGEEAHENGGSG